MGIYEHSIYIMNIYCNSTYFKKNIGENALLNSIAIPTHNMYKIHTDIYTVSRILYIIIIHLE